jgi:hypothetical protein
MSPELHDFERAGRTALAGWAASWFASRVLPWLIAAVLLVLWLARCSAKDPIVGDGRSAQTVALEHALDSVRVAHVRYQDSVTAAAKEHDRVTALQEQRAIAAEASAHESQAKASAARQQLAAARTTADSLTAALAIAGAEQLRADSLESALVAERAAKEEQRANARLFAAARDSVTTDLRTSEAARASLHKDLAKAVDAGRCTIPLTFGKVPCPTRLESAGGGGLLGVLGGYALGSARR